MQNMIDGYGLHWNGNDRKSVKITYYQRMSIPFIYFHQNDTLYIMQSKQIPKTYQIKKHRNAEKLINNGYHAKY